MTGFRPRFFVPEVDTATRADRNDVRYAETGLCGAEVVLDAEDSHHATRVLRLKPGDECEVVVGSGGGGRTDSVSGGVAVYAATVCGSVDPMRVRLTARLESGHAGATYTKEVGLFQALGRATAMEYALEKGTEVGASFFVFLKAAGSPKGSESPSAERLARWRRIVREAAKQSKQTAIPSVEVVDSLDVAVEESLGAGISTCFLEPRAPECLDRVVARHARDSTGVSRIVLWIGPEGGWAPEESGRLLAAGIQAARLGRSVLRTETAGPVAVAVARLALGDW